MSARCGGRLTDHRVVRGGSFNNNQRNLRVAYRNNNDPDDRNNNIGFRVVVSTFFDTGIVRRVLRLAGRGEEWRGLSLAEPARARAGRIPTVLHPGAGLVQDHLYRHGHV